MLREEFEKLVAEALLELPEEIRAKMDNVAVVVENLPSAEQNQKGRVQPGALLLGLYEGVPQSKRGPYYTMVLPDKISIFQDSIEQVAQSPEAIREQVKNTVWHEVAHHFGFAEDEVRKLDRKRRLRAPRP